MHRSRGRGLMGQMNLRVKDERLALIDRDRGDSRRDAHRVRAQGE